MYYTFGGVRNILIHWFMNSLDISGEKCAALLAQFYRANMPEKLCEAIREKKANEQA